MLAEAELDLSGYEIFRNAHPFGVMVENAGPTALLKEGVGVRLRSDGISYEQLPWYWSLFLDVATTAGAGPFTHTYDPGISAAWAPDAATLEGRWTDGATNEDIEVAYVMLSSLRLRGEGRGQIEAEGEGFGRRLVDVAITSLTLPTTIEPIRMADLKVYVNDTFALADVDAPVAGILTNQVESFELEMANGVFPWWGADGNLYFSEHKESGAKGFTLRLSGHYDSTAGSGMGAFERTKAAARTLRYVTLAFTGSSGRIVRIVLGCQHENGEFMPGGQSEGMDTVELNMVAQTDGSAKIAKVVVTNNEAAAL
jgi:hypothetical protein